MGEEPVGEPGDSKGVPISQIHWFPQILRKISESGNRERSNMLSRHTVGTQ